MADVQQEISMRSMDGIMDAIGSLSYEDKKRIAARLIGELTERVEEETALHGPKGDLIGYFVPRRIRMQLATPKLIEELAQRRKSPGKTMDLDEAIARLETEENSQEG
jgi:hypothetical protein